MDEGSLRVLVPRVLAGLVRRGEDFEAAEDALQEALLEALRVWPEHPPRDPRAWLTTVATRRLVHARPNPAPRARRAEGPDAPTPPPAPGAPPAPPGGGRLPPPRRPPRRGRRRHPLPAVLLLLPRPGARLPG